METIDNVKVFDHHDAITALRAVVKGREDFVYTNSEDYRDMALCVNWVRDEEGGPWRASCVVGHVLTSWDYPEDFKLISRYNGIRVTMGLWSGARATDHAKAVLGVAQYAQDREGGTWGEALRRAEEVYAEADPDQIQDYLNNY
jgi:hypothetical protein